MATNRTEREKAISLLKRRYTLAKKQIPGIQLPPVEKIISSLRTTKKILNTSDYALYAFAEGVKLSDEVTISLQEFYKLRRNIDLTNKFIKELGLNKPLESKEQIYGLTQTEFKIREQRFKSGSSRYTAKNDMVSNWERKILPQLNESFQTAYWDMKKIKGETFIKNKLEDAVKGRESLPLIKIYDSKDWSIVQNEYLLWGLFEIDETQYGQDIDAQFFDGEFFD